MKKNISKYFFVAMLMIAIGGSFSASIVSADAGGMGNDGNLGGTGSDSNIGGTGNDGNIGGTGSDGNTERDVFYLQNPLKFNSVGEIINGFVDIFTYLVILFAVLMIIYVGLRFVLAQGNTEELKARKDQLLWLLVGVAIVIGARLLISVVINTLEATGVVDPNVINSAEDALNGR